MNDWSPGEWCYIGNSVLVPGGAVVKNPLASAGDTQDAALIPGSGRSPGGGNDNPLAWTEEPGGLQSLGSQKNWT